MKLALNSISKSHRFERGNIYLTILISLVALLSFIKLGQHPLAPWDESRRAINALEISNTNDLVNLYFKGSPESFNFKPPLLVWCQAVAFKLFGVNEFSLRLPAALAIVVAFIVLFKFISLYRSPSFAFCTCLILASVKGWIGWHVGRTGDTDALLCLFLLLSLYHLMLYIDFNQDKFALYAGLFLGIAFFVKGPASWVLLPGIFLYLLITREIIAVFKSKFTWLSLMIAMAFPIAWYLVQEKYGIKTVHDGLDGNSFDKLFSVDIWSRFAEHVAGEKELFRPDFFIYSLDKTFNLWHFVFLGILIVGIVQLFVNRKKTISFFTTEDNRLILLSLCLYLPLAVFLSLAANSHSWYLAPVLPFVSIITFWGISKIWERSKWIKVAFWSLLAFTLVRQFLLFLQTDQLPKIISANAKIFNEAAVIIELGVIEQDVLAYLYLFDKKMQFSLEPCPLDENTALVISKNENDALICDNARLIYQDENYSVFVAGK